MRHIGYKTPRGAQQVISIESGAEETHTLLDSEYWQRVWFSVDGNERMHLHYRDGPMSTGAGYIFVRTADFERLYPKSPAAEAAIKDGPPLRRRGPVLKPDWHAIDGEIARRCHDKSGRVVVPKNELKFAGDMLQWCVDTDRPEPSESEMREAVKAICAALRKI
jgi:hypothetical protein